MIEITLFTGNLGEVNQKSVDNLVEQIQKTTKELYPEAQVEINVEDAVGVCPLPTVDGEPDEELQTIVEKIWANFDWVVDEEENEEEEEE